MMTRRTWSSRPGRAPINSPCDMLWGPLIIPVDGGTFANLDLDADPLILSGERHFIIIIAPDCQLGSRNDKGGNTSEGRSAQNCPKCCTLTGALLSRAYCIHAAKRETWEKTLRRPMSGGHRPGLPRNVGGSVYSVFFQVTFEATPEGCCLEHHSATNLQHPQ